MLDVTIDTTQQVQVTLKPVDAAGAPFTLASPPSWTVTAGIATVVVAPDGLSAQLVSSDTPGDSLFTVKDTSPGGTLSDTITLHVDQATPPPPVLASFGLVQGAVTPKVPATPTPVPVPSPAPSPTLSSASVGSGSAIKKE